MTRFSANLGFLWSDLPLPEAIRAAHAAGFDAVECHWPYDIPPEQVTAALQETGLPMLGLNTSRGDPLAGDNGLTALPDRIPDARAAISAAITYAAATGTARVHVMAGFAEEQDAHDTFVANLRFACEEAAPHGITILIEPLNHYDAPGYFLSTTDEARRIIAEVGAPNLRLMFDCYHVQLMEGDITHRLTELLPIIGHVQFAGVPDRGRPDRSELNYAHVFAHLAELGWQEPLGAEYLPAGDTAASLGWMPALR